MPIYKLLQKFDGAREHDDVKTGRRRYRLTRLPPFLALHMKRFAKNNFFWEKNPTIVNFPVRNLELRDVIPIPTGVHLLCPNVLRIRSLAPPSGIGYHLVVVSSKCSFRFQGRLGRVDLLQW